MWGVDPKARREHTAWLVIWLAGFPVIMVVVDPGETDFRFWPVLAWSISWGAVGVLWEKRRWDRAWRSRRERVDEDNDNK